MSRSELPRARTVGTTSSSEIVNETPRDRPHGAVDRIFHAAEFDGWGRRDALGSRVAKQRAGL